MSVTTALKVTPVRNADTGALEPATIERVTFDGFREIQAHVGGTFAGFGVGEGVSALCGDEALFNNPIPNVDAYAALFALSGAQSVDPIFGTFLFVRDGEEDYESITDADEARIRAAIELVDTKRRNGLGAKFDAFAAQF